MAGGHNVPKAKIKKRYYRSVANCVEALPLVDRAYLYDNSEDNVDPLKMFKTVNGNVAKIYNDLVPWAKDIVASLARA